MKSATRSFYCDVCGKEFEGSYQRRYCSEDCRRQGFAKTVANRRSKRERDRVVIPSKTKTSRNAMTVSEVMAWIRHHYEETGILLSYGKAITIIERGELHENPCAY